MAGRTGPCLLLMCFLAFAGSELTKKTTSKPCAAQATDYGFVCVCNSTYCDTIVPPTKLRTGKYYHYTTSETSPGFSLKKGSFKKSGDHSTRNTSTEVHVNIDTTTTYQTFSGVGAGLSDSASYVYDLLPTAAQKNLIRSFFGTSGIELTFGRIPLGNTDFSLNFYSYDDTVGDVNMTDFALTTFELETKIPFIQAAMAATNRTLNLLATAWTSPNWMKDNNDTLPGMIIPSYNEAFARYVVKFFEAYSEQGIEYWGLSPLNEIIDGAEKDFNMSNVIMFPTQFREWIREDLGPMMEEAGYNNTKLVVLDDERPFVDWFADVLLSDNETAQYIDGFALHWYDDSDSNYGILDEFHNDYPDKFILYTEASGTDGSHSAIGSGRGGGGGGIELGNWEYAVKYIESMIQNYQHWSIGFMTWNLCLNTDGGPYLERTQEAPAIVNTTSGEFYKQPFYYALGHFSKFIYPGSVRVGFTVEDSFVDPRSGRPTGSTNPTSSYETVDGVATTNPDGSTTVIVYNPSSVNVTVVLEDSDAGTISATVEANSLNTFIYW